MKILFRFSVVIFGLRFLIKSHFIRDKTIPSEIYIDINGRGTPFSFNPRKLLAPSLLVGLPSIMRQFLKYKSSDQYTVYIHTLIKMFHYFHCRLKKKKIMVDFSKIQRTKKDHDICLEI